MGIPSSIGPVSARPGFDGPRRRLRPVVGKARGVLRDNLPELDPSELVLVACSGGPDSLALAAVAAFFQHRKAFRVGAVVVDHGLQEGSTKVAQHTAETLRQLGLAPVEIRTVQVLPGTGGPEDSARKARYDALEAAAVEHGARAVLLGHTLDDQAEQVMLGLARGSGTRSLSGMPARREFQGGVHLRPFLALRRSETEEICAVEGLEPWQDPSNADPGFTRSRIRHEVLPFLEAQLGPGLTESLYRSASILAQDADFLDRLAGQEFDRIAELSADQVLLAEVELNALPPALRHRVLALAVVELGGSRPSFERLRAAESLLRRQGSAGPVQLAGKVSAYRQARNSGPSYGKLVLKRLSQSQET